MHVSIVCQLLLILIAIGAARRPAYIGIGYALPAACRFMLCTFDAVTDLANLSLSLSLKVVRRVAPQACSRDS